MNVKGIVIRPSKFTVKETMDRLQAVLIKQGATVYARIDQQAEVNNTGLELAPLEFILFGNPKSGGPFMADNPLIALDLPLKIIAWEDDTKKVCIAYNEGRYIEERYALDHKPGSPFYLDPMIDAALNLNEG